MYDVNFKIVIAYFSAIKWFHINQNKKTYFRVLQDTQCFSLLNACLILSYNSRNSAHFFSILCMVARLLTPYICAYETFSYIATLTSAVS